MDEFAAVSSSFRDPSGFVYRHEQRFRRAIAASYHPHFLKLHSSGLYDHLVERGLLVAHREIELPPALKDRACLAIEPDQLEFESYPYEWCFSALKDAALATLGIQSAAIARGMILKDASAYNIQFMRGRPTLIDTLSFEEYVEGAPWVAYRQFCQHFLAPLLLMAKTDVSLNSLLRIHLDGIPLELASRLLPRRTRFSLAAVVHIHAHARQQRRSAASSGYRGRVSRFGLLGLLDNLSATVRRLRLPPSKTEWGDYYANTNYSAPAFEAKRDLTARLIAKVQPRSVWDLGANTGEFSRIASERQIPTVAFDIDPAAVEKNYLRMREQRETSILPLLLDLCNPSPAIGWANRERKSLAQRGPTDLVMALALVHHLAISNNLPLPRIAEDLHALCRHLIIEFVPKSDSQTTRLLATRRDIFPDYHLEGFRAAFQRHFEILEEAPVPGTERTLLLMRARCPTRV